jgi:asparagine synthase (glutamine-hydrolysing)
MCGITGWMVESGAEIPERLMIHMTDQIEHRGPDGDGFFFGDGVALGHRRLSIIDIEGGSQPMYSDDRRVVLSYNGEIYNFQALRRELESLGHRFKTASDSEVLLESYMQWGEACVEHLRGMFAFAIWDSRSQSLFLARDRLGIKPLYYCFLKTGGLIFGSELKALLVHPDLPCKLRLDALEDYLTLGYVPDPKTIIDGVFKLPPATTMRVQKGARKAVPKTYWTTGLANGADSISDASELMSRLSEAVKLRMIADVPLGAFLSGGVDSSAIVGLMASHSDVPIETCAIGSDDTSYDESRYAQIVADHFKTEHRSHLVSSNDESLIDRIVGIYDEPFADPSALPTYHVCALARETVKVALSGDGGDELFAGYRRHRFHMAEESLRAKLPLSVRQGIFGPLSVLYPKMDWAPQFLRAKSTFEALAMTSAQAYCQSVSKTPDRDRKRLHSKRMVKLLAGYHPSERFQELADEVKGADPLSVIQYIDLKTYLPGDILTKVDRASMAHGLEVRVPILDHEFMEWGLQVPPNQRIVGGEGKAVFKKQLRTFLPDSILDRPKSGFIVPTVNWMRNELADDVRGLGTSELFADSGLFDMNEIRSIGEEHISGKRDHHTSLWSLIMLEKSLMTLQLELP